MLLEQKNMESEEIELSEEFDFEDSENMIQFKIVYWGPGESGKTTNFFRLREKFDLLKLNRGYSVETTEGRTLWEDSLFLLFTPSAAVHCRPRSWRRWRCWPRRTAR